MLLEMSERTAGGKASPTSQSVACDPRSISELNGDSVGKPESKEKRREEPPRRSSKISVVVLASRRLATDFRLLDNLLPIGAASSLGLGLPPVLVEPPVRSSSVSPGFSFLRPNSPGPVRANRGRFGGSRRRVVVGPLANDRCEHRRQGLLELRGRRGPGGMRQDKQRLFADQLACGGVHEPRIPLPGRRVSTFCRALRALRANPPRHEHDHCRPHKVCRRCAEGCRRMAGVEA